jgi:hypothetical protein
MIRIAEDHFQAVRSFSSCSAIIHDDVRQARLNRDWTYFDKEQSSKLRGLNSAIQFPIYRNKNMVAEEQQKEPLGVLSIDASKAGFFQHSDVDYWTSNLMGFLANLALSERMYRSRISH